MDEDKSVLGRIFNWVRHPFKSDMGAGGWVLFLGLILIAVFFWSRVMAHVTKGIENV